MKLKKLLNQSVGMTVAEYNRVSAILFPNTELMQLTETQCDALAIAELDSALIQLSAMRDKLLLKQSKLGSAEYPVADQSYYQDTDKTRPRKA